MHWSYHSLVLSHWNIVCAVMCCDVHVCTVSVGIVIGIFSCIAGLLTYFVSAHQGSELISQRWLNIKRITLNKIIRCFLLNNSLKIICNFSPSFSFHLSRILFPLARRVITYWLDNNRFTLWKYTGTTVIECTLALVVDEVYDICIGFRVDPSTVPLHSFSACKGTVSGLCKSQFPLVTWAHNSLRVTSKSVRSPPVFIWIGQSLLAMFDIPQTVL